MYRPPNQTNFLEILNVTFEKIDTDKKRDFNKHVSYQQMYCS